MSLLGIDIGSSRVKAVAFTPEGKVLAFSEAEYRPVSPAPGQVELDPDLLWQIFVQVVRASAHQTKQDPAEALAISAHGETFFSLDRNSQPVGAAIMNIDNRAQAEAQWLQEQLGKEKLYQITGAVIHPMYPLAKIKWLQTHDRERYSTTASFASVGDFILRRLGLPPYIDYSLASRYLAFDIRAHVWSEELLACVGLAPSQLPIPVPAGSVVGKLSASIARELGLKPDTLVALGGHDQPCSALGVGALALGQVGVSMGTYECLTMTCAQPTLNNKALAASLNTYCHVIPDAYVTLAFFPAGILLQWLTDMLGKSHADLSLQLSDGASGLVITPHLIGACNPYWEPRAKGAIYGLSTETNSASLYQGALEGIACEFALNAQTLATSAGALGVVRATGGGARSRFGLQLRAALSGVTIELVECQEATCLGAALLAGVATGKYENLQTAVAATVRVTDVVVPDPSLAESYQQHFQRYCAFFPTLAPLRESERNS
jgi:xylulokinase